MYVSVCMFICMYVCQNWPSEAWSWDSGGSSVVSGTGKSVVDPSGPVGRRVGTPWIGLVQGKSHRCSTGVGSGEFGGQADILSFLSCSLGSSWAVFVVWHGALSCCDMCLVQDCQSVNCARCSLSLYRWQLRSKLRCPWCKKAERWLSHIPFRCRCQTLKV